MTENEREAGTIRVAISNYVAAAALGVIAGGAALYAYVSQNFDTPLAFQVLMLLAVAALVTSIVLGGIGSDTVADMVAHEDYTKEIHLDSFNWQAILTLVGLVLVLVATVVGVGADRRESETEQRLDTLSRDIGELEQRLDAQSREIRRLRAGSAARQRRGKGR